MTAGVVGVAMGDIQGAKGRGNEEERGLLSPLVRLSVRAGLVFLVLRMSGAQSRGGLRRETVVDG